MRGLKTLVLGLMTWVLVTSNAHADRMPTRYAWWLFQLRAARYAALTSTNPDTNTVTNSSALPAVPVPSIPSVPEPTASAPISSMLQVSTPTPTPTTVETVAASPPAPAVSEAPTWTVQTPPAPPSPTVDAFLNLGSGPYPGADRLTTGGAQPWYNSPVVASLFGGTPTEAQRADFSSTVLQRVERTFQLASVPVSLTTDPNTPAAHTLSLVSGTTSTWGPVLGLTTLGDSGFSFVEEDARHAQSVDDLEWIAAHNIAHELMLAFGVPEAHDQSGLTIDSTVGNLSMFLDPNATFSPSAAQDLLSRDFRANSVNGPFVAQAQDLNASTVPEPSTYLLWAVIAGAALARRRRKTAPLSISGYEADTSEVNMGSNL